MALLQVSDFQYFSKVRGQILPVRQRNLVDRTNHYNFGSKTQEFAVPPGLEVSDFKSGIKLKKKSEYSKPAVSVRRALA